MSDWQAGDLALCVNDRKFVHGQYLPGLKSTIGIVVGRVYTVSGIVGRAAGPRGVSDLLAIEGINWRRCLDGGVGAWRFIRITPPEADAFDLSVIEQMTGAPVEVVG